MRHAKASIHLMANDVSNDREHAAEREVLRRLLERVDCGDIIADEPQARALVRHLKGALAALEALEEGDEDYSSGAR